MLRNTKRLFVFSRFSIAVGLARLAIDRMNK
jgi:hypothetical protein